MNSKLNYHLKRNTECLPPPENENSLKNRFQTDSQSNLNFETGTIWNADNLDVMRGMNSETVDLIYLDPPFNSARNYQGRGKASKQKFIDNWSEKQLAEWDMLKGIRDNVDLVRTQDWWPMMELVKDKHSKEMYYYLSFMAVRLLQMRRILKQTGTIYLHCDDSSNSYLRMIMDYVFNRKNGPGTEGRGAEITWKRSEGKNNVRTRFGRVTDTIYMYHNNDKCVFNTQYTKLSVDTQSTYKYNDNDGRGNYSRKGNLAPPSGIGYKYSFLGYNPPKNGWRITKKTMEKLYSENRLYLPEDKSKRIMKKVYFAENKGKPVTNLWTDIKNLWSQDKETTGWDTQKLLSLLTRIIKVSSNPGDIVFDPFCGCATTLLAAANNGRRFIGCEIDKEVVDITLMRWGDQRDLLYENKEKRFIEAIRTTTVCPQRTEKSSCNEPPTQLTRSDVRRLYGREIYGIQEGYCPGCKEHEKFKNMDVDHKIPRKKGGTNDRENLQLLCRKCNTSKGGRTMEEWEADRQGNIL